MSKIYIGSKDDDLLIFLGQVLLYFIRKSMIFSTSCNETFVTIKLPYFYLKFKLELKEEDIKAHAYVKYLIKIADLKTLYPERSINSLSCNLIECPEPMYQALAQSFSESTNVSLSVLINNNPDFQLKYLKFTYKKGENKNKYLLLSHKEMQITDYKIDNKNQQPFFEISITWCHKTLNGNKCVLICSSNLFNQLKEKIQIIEKRENLTSQLLNHYKNATKHVWFYSADNSRPRDNYASFIFVEIDPTNFSAVLALLNSALKPNQCYFNDDLCIYFKKWLADAFKCSQYLSNRHNVVIEDTDDTPISFIIGSLSKILIDPCYCTFDGFIGLIRDDWINRGYFYILGNEVDKRKDILKNRLHFFYAWLTCVQFLIYKYPIIFEFSYWMIHYIINNLWTDRFYPFSWKCPDGDIFARLNAKRENLTNYGYYLNKSPQIYSSLMEEIKISKNSAENQYDEILKIILLADFTKFQIEFKTIDLDIYNCINLNPKSQIYLKTGETSKFILSSLYDPGIDYASASFTPLLPKNSPNNGTEEKEKNSLPEPQSKDGLVKNESN